MSIVTPVPADLLRPFQLERSQIRGRLVRLADTVDQVLTAHAYPPAVSALLGELLLLAGGLAGGLKFDGKFSLQIRGGGPIRLMVADCTNDGRMRGYAGFDQDAALPATPGTDLAALLGDGVLALTVDQAASGGETYQGIVPLEGATLTDCMLLYFRQSEQISTGIRTALGRDPATGRWRGGAIILQALPETEAQEDRVEDWRRAMVLLQTVTDAELLGPEPEPDRVLWRLFHEEGVRVFPELALAAGCSCDEDRVVAMLQGFEPDDLAAMRDEAGGIEVTCQFCSRHYGFPAGRVDALMQPKRH